MSILAATALVACHGGDAPAPSASPVRTTGRADIGGYSLAFECEGEGTPTVILEAGYTASGIDTFGEILSQVGVSTRVCTYDRAGDGTSDARPPSVKPLTGATQAGELQALLSAIKVAPPYVVVGHSYGGMVAREFAALAPADVTGMVLIDASSEPEIPVYERLHAGPWIDGTVTPGPNQRLDMHATVHELLDAPSLGGLPLVVITAGVLEDEWLVTAPRLTARSQTRLAGLSSNSIHVLDKGVGHFIPESDPAIIVAAVDAAVAAARAGGLITPCAEAFPQNPSAACLDPGELGKQQVKRAD